jgi:RNA 3'-terminal phosphate cyclase (GTP)
MITLDGSMGEGGGQIVRTALAISSLTGQPFKITKIREARKDAGLKAQHVHCVKALQELCNAKADGAEIGSRELLYIPGKINAKNTTIDIGTAGSITLLLQAVLLPCLFANKSHTLKLIGGTDTSWSMPIDYLTNVLIPQYRRVAGINVKLLKRGYYPKGGGHAEISIKPEIKRNEFETFEAFNKTLAQKSFSITKQGELVSIKGVSHASKSLQNAQVAERQASAARQELSRLKTPIEITTEYSEATSTGSGITLWAIFAPNNEDLDTENPIRIGADALGEKGKPAEQVGKEAANQLLAEIESKAPTDSHLADNLIPLMALCKPSTIKTSRITPHSRTNIQVVEAFLGKTFKIEDNTIKSM